MANYKSEILQKIEASARIALDKLKNSTDITEIEIDTFKIDQKEIFSLTKQLTLIVKNDNWKLGSRLMPGGKLPEIQISRESSLPILINECQFKKTPLELSRISLPQENNETPGALSLTSTLANLEDPKSKEPPKPAEKRDPNPKSSKNKEARGTLRYQGRSSVPLPADITPVARGKQTILDMVDCMSRNTDLRSKLFSSEITSGNQFKLNDVPSYCVRKFSGVGGFRVN